MSEDCSADLAGLVAKAKVAYERGGRTEHPEGFQRSFGGDPYEDWTQFAERTSQEGVIELQDSISVAK